MPEVGIASFKFFKALLKIFKPLILTMLALVNKYILNSKALTLLAKLQSATEERCSQTSCGKYDELMSLARFKPVTYSSDSKGFYQVLSGPKKISTNSGVHLLENTPFPPGGNIS